MDQLNIFSLYKQKSDNSTRKFGATLSGKSYQQMSNTSNLGYYSDIDDTKDHHHSKYVKSAMDKVSGIIGSIKAMNSNYHLEKHYLNSAKISTGKDFHLLKNKNKNFDSYDLYDDT